MMNWEWCVNQDIWSILMYYPRTLSEKSKKNNETYKRRHLSYAELRSTGCRALLRMEIF